MRLLVLGVTGMLGHMMFRTLFEGGRHEVWGSMRGDGARRFFREDMQSWLMPGVDVLDQDVLAATLLKLRPDVVINCVGLIKQLADAENPLAVLPINAVLPHRLAALCGLCEARLIHVSTDCVFSGRKGAYSESDVSDAEDLYGKSKFIGELHDNPGAVTLRTSIIGHELNSNHSLVDWFLSQKVGVKGYRKAIFSGLPTIELSRVVRDYVLPDDSLSGLYHVSAEPIDKYSLLKLVGEVYGKHIPIEPDDRVCIDRSLDSSKFSAATGYHAPEWQGLIERMHQGSKD